MATRLIASSYASFTQPDHLLIKHGEIRPISLPLADSLTGYDLPQQTGLHIPLDDHNAVVVLERGRHKRAGLVEREVPRVAPACRGGLHVSQCPVVRIDGEGDDRIGGCGCR
jgi:hypothetical protein